MNALVGKLREYADKGRAAVRLMRHRPPVAPTPADTVYSSGEVTLQRYRSPNGAPRVPTPVVFVPSLINRPYILDLMPGRSMVEYLVAQGFDVMMVDWGHPRAEDRYTTFDEYIEGVLHRCVRRAARISPSGQVSLIGYCMGGTIAAIYASLHQPLTRNLVAFAAPLDFAQAGLLGRWTDGQRFNPDLVVDSLGNVPWPLMQASFHMLVPTLIAQKLLWLYDRLQDDDFVDHFVALETWGNDNVSFPGECFRRYIKDLYQRNMLVKGELRINGKPARLQQIECPLLNVVALHDHIVPAVTARPLHELAASADKDCWELAGGHIGAIVSRTASKRFWPRLVDWLRQH